MTTASGSSLTPDEHRLIRREVIRLAWPAILQGFFNTLMFVVDTAMLGHFDAAALAAMGIVGPVMYTLAMVFSALGVGTVATVARDTGEGDGAKRIRSAATSLVLSAAAGVVLAAAGYLLFPRLLGFFDVRDDPRVLEMARDYVRTMAAGLAFMLVSVAAQGILRAAGDTRTPMVVSAIANLLNVAGNYALIFGHWGSPRLGVVGAALSTAVMHGVMALLTAGYLFTRRSPVLLRWGDLAAITRESCRRLIRISLPAAIEPIVIQTGFLMYIKAVTELGAEALAAHRAAITVESFSFLPGFGCSVAASAIVGQYLGAGRPEAAREAIRKSARLGTYLMATMGLVFLLAPAALLRPFLPPEKAPEHVVLLGAVCLSIVAFEQPFMALAMVLSGALRGAGDTRSPVVVGAIGAWLVRVPLAFGLAFGLGLGLYGIWITMVADWLVRAACFAWLVRRGRWMEEKV